MEFRAIWNPAMNRWAIINRPYGTEKDVTFYHPSDESLGYYQPTLRVESLVDTSR